MRSSQCKPIPRGATLVTQAGTAPSQPSVGVSTTSPIYAADGTYVPGVCRLNVFRHYDHLPNEFGGRGVSKPLDANGMLFISTDEARRFALERGYLQVYRNCAGHERRIEIERRYPGAYNRLLHERLNAGGLLRAACELTGGIDTE